MVAWDHPRVGGEKSPHAASCPRWIGSPPRGRGKDIFPNRLTCPVWITPAWAGKSRPQTASHPAGWDHPRVGGEKTRGFFNPPDGRGSPPRGRGKASHASGCPCGVWITPAWAGKREFQHVRHPQPGDHPRVGGEKQKMPVRTDKRMGSPPRGRGKGLSLQWHPSRRRITPAWAGKRLKRSHRSGIFISGPIPFHSVLHRPAGSGGSRAGRDGSPVGQPQNAGPA